jgi:hypothetical protein
MCENAVPLVMILLFLGGELMGRFVEEADRGQWTLLPECLDDFIDESNPVRAIDVGCPRCRKLEAVADRAY